MFYYHSIGVVEYLGQLPGIISKETTLDVYHHVAVIFSEKKSQKTENHENAKWVKYLAKQFFLPRIPDQEPCPFI